MGITACIFDAYGTLFDVGSAARNAANEPAYSAIHDNWAVLANDWRAKQLEYTWLRAITKTHCDFWQVTRDGLDYALELHNLGHDTKLRARLLDLYWELDAYPEAVSVLKSLKNTGYDTAILSNGSPAMLDAAVQSSGLGHSLDDVLSVEDVGVFKPDTRVYQMSCDRFCCKPENILFVSSNGWDIAGATGFGFQTVWINRSGAPQDRLAHAPMFKLPDLGALPDLLQKLDNET